MAMHVNGCVLSIRVTTRPAQRVTVFETTAVDEIEARVYNVKRVESHRPIANISSIQVADADDGAEWEEGSCSDAND